MVTFHFKLDRRPKKKLKQVYVRPYFKRMYTELPTGIYTTEDAWEKWSAGNLRTNEARQLNYEIEQIRKKAEDSITHPFSFDAFKVLFSDKSKDITITQAFQLKINKLKTPRTIEGYEYTARVLESYNLPALQDFTHETLEDLEAEMADKYSWSSIGIFMRNLRTVFNHCIHINLLANYPFKNYTPPHAENVKKALTDEEIRYLLEYQSDDYYNQRAVDFWKICYLTFGRYPSDLKAMTWDQVKKDRIIFTKRQKTKRMRAQKAFEVPMTPILMELIKKYSNMDGKYVFGINDLRAFGRRINGRLKEIGKDFSIKCTLSTARHSAATKLMRSGSNKKFIQDALGHADFKTTENYLSSFSTEYTQEMSEKLIS